MSLRVIAYRLRFGTGLVLASTFVLLPIFIFFRSLFRGGRAFHPRGSVCRAEVTALDELGKRLEGAARVRFASSTAEENSPEPSIIGMGIKLGDDQDLGAGTFESFGRLGEATRNTDVADYLANEYGSVAPWRTSELGVFWFRLVPVPEAKADKTGVRTERLDADIAANRARFILEVREGPNAGDAVRLRLAEIRLVERLPADDPRFRISMFRRGRGIAPTGFRNGLRSIVYPVSQLARTLRGG